MKQVLSSALVINTCWLNRHMFERDRMFLTMSCTTSNILKVFEIFERCIDCKRFESSKDGLCYLKSWGDRMCHYFWRKNPQNFPLFKHLKGGMNFTQQQYKVLCNTDVLGHSQEYERLFWNLRHSEDNDTLLSIKDTRKLRKRKM